jgi:nucleoid-associated protein YgaU
MNVKEALAPMIGIRLASGEFYPITGEVGAQAKRLVLTTVKDDQPSVHIDLYRSADMDFRDAAYVGSLVLDGLPARPKQIPDIELTIKVDEDGAVEARAVDAESGISRSLSLGAQEGGSAGGPERFDTPDFELSPQDPYASADKRFSAYLPPDSSSSKDVPPAGKNRRGKPGAGVLIVILGGLLALALIGFLVFMFASGRWAFPPWAGPGPSPSMGFMPSPRPRPSPSPAPSLEPSLEPSPAPTPAPSPSPKNGSKGLTHRIRWGDTLWHISIRYYGTPWLYMRIAKANSIKNPDLIISGRSLWIPPR